MTFDSVELDWNGQLFLLLSECELDTYFDLPKYLVESVNT